MTDLPNYSLNRVCASIDSTLKQNFFEHVLKLFSDEDYKEKYLEDYIVSLIDDKYSENWKKEDIVSLRTSKVKYRQRVKKRWIERIEEELKTLTVKKNAKPTILGEMNHAQEHLRLYGMKKFIEQYNGAKSVDEVIELRMEQVRSWANDTESFLTDFFFINSMTKSQLDTAFELDFLIEILKININDFDGNFWKYVFDRPQALSNPIFRIQPKRLKTKVVQKNATNLVEVNENVISKNLIVRTIIERPENVSVKMTALDQTDSSIIDYLLSKTTQDTLTDGTVFFEVADLVNKAMPEIVTKSGKFYDEVEKRIDRLRFYSLEIVEKKDKSKDAVHRFNIIQHTTFDNKENGRRIGVVTFSKLMKDQIASGLTIKMYTNQIRHLKEKASKILIYPLEQERNECHKKDKENLVASYDYNFFLRNIIFPSKNKENNLEIIEKSLQDCKNNFIVIKDFQRIGDSFNIKFLPFQEHEIQDLIGNDLLPQLTQ